MAKREGPPTSRKSLERLLHNAAHGDPQLETKLKRAFAATILGQMAPEGTAFKGAGTSPLRLGIEGSRLTTDLDASKPYGITHEEYTAQLIETTAKGWKDFTATIATDEHQHIPEDDKGHPIMDPEIVIMRHRVSLSYKGEPFHNTMFEVGGAKTPGTPTELVVPHQDLIALFAKLQLPAPDAMKLITAERQIAEKLQAALSAVDLDERIKKRREEGKPEDGNPRHRAHDLVDIRLLVDWYSRPEVLASRPLDLASIGTELVGLLKAESYSGKLLIVGEERWKKEYKDRANGLGVPQQLDEALEWSNYFLDGCLTACAPGLGFGFGSTWPPSGPSLPGPSLI
ncbi:MAG: nucleotidyl transferase AbiEii/AbiGii toxin family protein [Actinomycetota bacterium]|nr:nucleotidyl transferase AbiEii/AbiGii toxin family protein [Actinomycetota bacterium]